MGRRKAREHAFKLVYQIQINNDQLDGQIEQYFMDNDIQASSIEYITNAVKYIAQHHEEIDVVLSGYLAKKWSIERIPKVEKAIMRLAYYEMLNLEDVPKSVAINEAVELAKSYGGEDAGRYINAVLANIPDGGR